MLLMSFLLLKLIQIKWQIYPDEVFYAKDLLPMRVTISFGLLILLCIYILIVLSDTGGIFFQFYAWNKLILKDNWGYTQTKT